jgi:hypothetical protein
MSGAATSDGFERSRIGPLSVMMESKVAFVRLSPWLKELIVKEIGESTKVILETVIVDISIVPEWWERRVYGRVEDVCCEESENATESKTKLPVEVSISVG